MSEIKYMILYTRENTHQSSLVLFLEDGQCNIGIANYHLVKVNLAKNHFKGLVDDLLSVECFERLTPEGGFVLTFSMHRKDEACTSKT